MNPTITYDTMRYLHQMAKVSRRLYQDVTLDETPLRKDLKLATKFCKQNESVRRDRETDVLYLQFLWILPSATGLFEEHLRRQLKETATSHSARREGETASVPH